MKQIAHQFTDGVTILFMLVKRFKKLFLKKKFRKKDIVRTCLQK